MLTGQCCTNLNLLFHYHCDFVSLSFSGILECHIIALVIDSWACIFYVYSLSVIAACCHQILPVVI